MGVEIQMTGLLGRCPECDAVPIIINGVLQCRIRFTRNGDKTIITPHKYGCFILNKEK